MSLILIYGVNNVFMLKFVSLLKLVHKKVLFLLLVYTLIDVREPFSTSSIKLGLEYGNVSKYEIY